MCEWAGLVIVELDTLDGYIRRSVVEWLDGWTDGHTEPSGWADGQTDRQAYTQWIDGGLDQQTVRWTDNRKDRQADEQRGQEMDGWNRLDFTIIQVTWHLEKNP